MKAYVFMKFEPGADLAEAAHALKEPGIESFDLVIGAYDAIAVVRANDLASLGQLAQRIRNCPGVQDSITCPVIS